jgi:hypothetical protein
MRTLRATERRACGHCLAIVEVGTIAYQRSATDEALFCRAECVAAAIERIAATAAAVKVGDQIYHELLELEPAAIGRWRVHGMRAYVGTTGHPTLALLGHDARISIARARDDEYSVSVRVHAHVGAHARAAAKGQIARTELVHAVDALLARARTL